MTMAEEMLDIREFAHKAKYSERQIRQYCISGKIKGAFKLTTGARKWLIPATAVQELGRTKPRETEALLPDQGELLKVEAELKHSGDLLNLLGRFEAQVTEIHEKRPLGIRRGSSCGVNSESYPLESWSYPGDKYPEETCKWKWKDSRIAEFQLDVEEDRLFKYLRQHLEGENVWRLYEGWKESFRQALKIFDDWERKDIGGDHETIVNVITPIEDYYDNLMEDLLRIQQKRVLPGKCDCCPD
jgi:hypothetical protein